MTDNSIHSFVGVGTPDDAVAEATAKANDFLKSHAWMRSDGNTAYVISGTLYTHQGVCTYVLLLVGPDKPTVDAVVG